MIHRLERAVTLAGLRRTAWLAAGIAALTVPLIMAPATSFAAERTTTAVNAAPAPPTALELAAVHASSSNRKVVVKTTDRRPGGKLEVNITWSGNGPYKGDVYGSVQDLEADGYCVQAYAWADGALYGLNTLACPAPSIKPVHIKYAKKWRVLVQVCLWKNDRLYYCSRWT